MCYRISIVANVSFDQKDLRDLQHRQSEKKTHVRDLEPSGWLMYRLSCAVKSSLASNVKELSRLFLYPNNLRPLRKVLICEFHPQERDLKENYQWRDVSDQTA